MTLRGWSGGTRSSGLPRVTVVDWVVASASNGTLSWSIGMVRALCILRTGRTKLQAATSSSLLLLLQFNAKLGRVRPKGAKQISTV